MIKKFRAWDMVLKEWIAPSKFVIDGDGCLRIDNEKEWVLIQENNRIEIGQFCDMKDKNGKEICEDDIIIANNDWLRNSANVVEFDNGWFHFDGIPMHTFESSELEIVGNMLENPDFFKYKMTG